MRCYRILLVASLAGLAGCATGPDGSSATGSVFASSHTLLSKKAVAIAAGTTYYVNFDADGLASYDFFLTDGSSVDIGFIQSQDVNEYHGGTAVYTWAYHQGISRATDGVNLKGAYAFVIHCDNAFADCDGMVQSLTATY